MGGILIWVRFLAALEMTIGGKWQGGDGMTVMEVSHGGENHEPGRG